ncbi:helix-turn-helix domain-containing protein [Amnibacterium kyonggiense]|uniref:Helix-turn-helix protein n=1 Tax=Amnibacterium kyonggiense TaxID=595671 RepID=A0A4R7FGV7_9MICO|nr:helix-turn-helix domain-containing protein [Amnibacterium kyonggiense]TDS75907.1 helix-turn-helix protein [Amnibacterium kyonggiense]
MSTFEEIVRRIVREEIRAALEELQLAASPAPAPVQSLLGTRAAAERLGVAPATLRDWRVDRKGPPAVKYGRLVKYRVEDLDHWIADQRR